MADWQRVWFPWKQKFTIDNTGIGELTSLPVTIRSHYIPAKDAPYVHFVDSSGNLLPHELDAVIPKYPLPQSVYHVTVPTIASGGTPDIFALYGTREAGSAEDVANVWDANFVGVWHFAEQTGQYQDSKASHHATTTTVSGRPPSPMGFAACFDGVDDYIHVPYHVDFQITDTLTLEAFANIVADGADAGSYNQLVGTYLGYGAGEGYGLCAQRANNSVYAFARLADDSNYEYDSSSAYPPPTGWKSFSAVYNCPGTIQVYIDGAPDVTPNTSTQAIYASVNSLRMGQSGGTSHRWAGYLAEVRISNVARTADWIEASAKNMLDTYVTEHMPQYINRMTALQALTTGSVMSARQNLRGNKAAMMNDMLAVRGTDPAREQPMERRN